jgi:hypothetical protein
MKRLLAYQFLVLVLIFSLQSWTKADDISDFQIEGISIGDSALDFFSINEIKNNSMNFFKSKRFTPVQNDQLSFFTTYDAVDFVYRTGDKEYIIHELAGVLYYENNVEDCYVKLREIETEMDKIFPFTKKNPEMTFKHRNDPTQKSLVTDIEYVFNNGDSVQLACYDYSEEHGSQDHLSVALATKEIYDFYINEAYK